MIAPPPAVIRCGQAALDTWKTKSSSLRMVTIAHFATFGALAVWAADPLRRRDARRALRLLLHGFGSSITVPRDDSHD